MPFATPGGRGLERPNISFVASADVRAQQARDELVARYGCSQIDDARVIVALGGDGFMLETLHRYLDGDVGVYGMNRGSVGFLMNAFATHDLVERIDAARPTILKPLSMAAVDAEGVRHEAVAFNEVSLFRQTSQTAKIRIRIDNVERMEEMMCDGVMVATAAGSTAYNLSAHGPILPIGSHTLALTPINAFRPRRWRGAILPDHSDVGLEILDHVKRPVSAAADSTEVRNVVRVDVKPDSNRCVRLLFDPEHNLEERILKEQFIA